MFAVQAAKKVGEFCANLPVKNAWNFCCTSACWVGNIDPWKADVKKCETEIRQYRQELAAKGFNDPKDPLLSAANRLEALGRKISLWECAKVVAKVPIEFVARCGIVSAVGYLACGGIPGYVQDPTLWDRAKLVMTCVTFPIITIATFGLLGKTFSACEGVIGWGKRASYIICYAAVGTVGKVYNIAIKLMPGGRFGLAAAVGAASYYFCDGTMKRMCVAPLASMAVYLAPSIFTKIVCVYGRVKGWPTLAIKSVVAVAGATIGKVGKVFVKIAKKIPAPHVSAPYAAAATLCGVSCLTDNKIMSSLAVWGVTWLFIKTMKLEALANQAPAARPPVINPNGLPENRRRHRRDSSDSPAPRAQRARRRAPVPVESPDSSAPSDGSTSDGVA